jgi:restriction system protein
MLTVAALACDGILEDADNFKKGLVLIPFDESDDDDTSDELSEGYIVRHEKLGFSETVKGKDERLLSSRLESIIQEWIGLWNQRHAAVAGERLADALNRDLAGLLSDSLSRDHVLNLEGLKSKESFESTDAFRALREQMEGIMPPPLPKLPITPPQPKYVEPEISFSQSIFRKKAILREASDAFDIKLEAWQKACERIEGVAAEKIAEHGRQLEEYEIRLAAMEERITRHRSAYIDEQMKLNAQVDEFAANYRSFRPDAVVRYVNTVLDRSGYPDIFPREREVEYNRDNHTLYLVFELPHPDSLPRERSVRHGSQAEPAVREPFTEKEFRQRYNEVVYKAILRHLHEVFSGDASGAVKAIQVSARVHTLNKGNGQFEYLTIATIFCTRGEFAGINLSQIDPTQCFRYLKGVSATELSDLIPVPAPHPFHTKNDSVVPAVKPLEPLDGEDNLANMDMARFGKNIMSLFEMEFRLVQGDIKLLQDKDNADGGFEAWGMDPEPIRGGKFIINARKSSHPVPSSAVKELYGSMMHEGANKGILITTADFQPDAYEFARNKPIILLSGSQLLTLFERHGIPARISFREAISLKSWLS